LRTKGERLYEENAAYVHRYLWALSGEPDTTEELTQECFYQALRVQWEPSVYRAGVYGGELPRRKNRKTLFYLAGYDCREIFSAELYFDVYDSSGASREAALTLPLEEPDFLTLYEYSEFAALLGLQDEPAMLRLTETRLLDADDSDVTAVYRSAEEPASWGGSRTTAELGLVYVLMGVAAALGGALLRYILRRDE